MTPAQIEKIVGIVSVLLPEVVTLVQSVLVLVQGADIPEATKEELIARIKQAQDSVPEWV